MPAQVLPELPALSLTMFPVTVSEAEPGFAQMVAAFASVDV